MDVSLPAVFPPLLKPVIRPPAWIDTTSPGSRDLVGRVAEDQRG